ncbi:MAG TPA: hypothetical protein ENH00_13545 [Actinobacteria bacterium]|nr:hypothetical protein BMS3Bbin01_02579 [bacterium BMS3Bbin01]HDH27195.1 hypothetical protein [Actinomycetota bacterium]
MENTTTPANPAETVSVPTIVDGKEDTPDKADLAGIPSDEKVDDDKAIALKPDHDPDAAWGVKTHKNGGEEVYYGYQESTLVQVPQGDDAADLEPRLIVRCEVTAASEDIVDVSLSLLDRLKFAATDLIVDRHYSYKAAKRWRDKLVTRGIDQHLDLRKDEQGFTELQHMRWAAGWPHCPATPDVHASIPRPGPSATKEQEKKFLKDIKARRAWAFRRVTSPDTRGCARWECPAVAGSIGCPLRAGSIDAAITLGLPIVEDAPDPASPDFPTCCSQRSVTIKPGKLRKLMQPHYWGSELWQKIYNMRTYVEGTYGNRKNRSTEDLTRGYFRVTGLALVNIATSFAAVSYNLRILRNWHERTGLGDPTHPLLQAQPENHGFIYLTKEQAEQIADQHKPEPTDTNATTSKGAA